MAKESVIYLKVESKFYDDKLKRAVQGMQHFEQQCEQAGKSLSDADKKTVEYVRALGDMGTVSTTTKGKLNELSNAFTELTLQYNNFTEEEKKSPIGVGLLKSLDLIKGRVVELKEQLSAVQGDLGGTLSSAANASSGAPSGGIDASKLGISPEVLKQLGSEMGKLGPIAGTVGKAITGAFGPIAAVIAAVVAVFKQLTEAYQRNSEAMEVLGNVTAPFKALWQQIQRLFDDLVKADVELYQSLGKTTEGFSALDAVAKTLSSALVVVRGAIAVIKTAIINVAEGVDALSQKVRGAIQGSKVQSFFKNIKDTIEGLFSRMMKWVGEFAKSDLGKRFHLDTLYNDLKKIIGAQDELTESNRKISSAEKQLEEQQRRLNESIAKRKTSIAKLRADASNTSKSPEERKGMLEKAEKLEKQNLQDTITLRQKELELIQLKNSLTATGDAGENAESQAKIALEEAKANFYNSEKSLNRQMSGVDSTAKNEAKSETSLQKAKYEEDMAAQIAALDRMAMNEQEYEDAVYKIKHETLEKIAKLYDEETEDHAKANAKVYELETQHQEKMVQLKAKADREAKQEQAKNAQLDNKILGGLTSAAKSINWTAADLGTTGIKTKINAGIDITEDEWKVFEDRINERLKELHLDPISIDFETGNVETVAKGTTDAWNAAAAAVNNVGSALQQIEDPAAKVAGIVMQAVANIALGFAQAVASPATGAAGVFGWIAAATAGLATMVSTIAAVKSATQGFAEGGMVGGNSYSGDNIVARLNSGEGVLTAQGVQNAAAMANSSNPMQNLQLSTEISGTNLRIVLNNDNRSKGGSRGYYANIH